MTDDANAPSAGAAMAGYGQDRDGYASGGGVSSSIDEALRLASEQTGVDPAILRAIVKIESGGDPRNATGSYKGLFQLSPSEFKRAGGTGDIFDPQANALAGAAKLKADGEAFQGKYGRAPTPGELYLVHQQGEGGAAAHFANPDAPAWENMASTAEGRQKGDGWAKQAIWGNVPGDMKAKFGSVENLTSRDFAALWNAKVEGGRAASHAGGQGTATVAKSDDPIRSAPPVAAAQDVSGPANDGPDFSQLASLIAPQPSPMTPMAPLPRIQPVSNSLLENPIMPYAANGGAIDHALFLAKGGKVRSLDDIQSYDFGPMTQTTRAGYPNDTLSQGPAPRTDRAVNAILDYGSMPARAYVDQFNGATDAVADAMADPSLANMTNAGVRTGAAVGSPLLAAGSAVGGFGLAALDQFAPSFVESASAKSKAGKKPDLKPAIFEDSAPVDQTAEKFKDDPELSLLYSQIQSEQRDATRDYPGRNGDQSRAQAAERLRVLQSQLSQALAKRQFDKTSAEKSIYDGQVANAVAARDKARDRDHRFQDTPVGKVYDKLGGYAPLAAAVIPGSLFGLAKGPAKTWGDASSRALTGIGFGMGASNVPSAYDMTYAPAVNPEKEAMRDYAYNLPDGHPDKAKAAALAETLPERNPVQAQGERMFSDPNDVAMRNIFGAFEGFGGQEVGGILPRAAGGIFKKAHYGHGPKTAVETAIAEIDAAEALALRRRASAGTAAKHEAAAKLDGNSDIADLASSGPAGPASKSGVSAAKLLPDPPNPATKTASDIPSKPKVKKQALPKPDAPPSDPVVRDGAADEIRRFLGTPPEPTFSDGGAIAQALHLATGGSASTPWFAKSEARSMTGPLHSSVAGRTDHLPISVPAGSHVLPADFVSSLGQGNTNAGMNVLGHMFSSGPYGTGTGHMGGHAMKPPSLRFAAPHRAMGGRTDAVPIMAAGGEYVVPPEHVAVIGGGDMDAGHEILDRWILNTRSNTIRTLQQLPPPAKD